MKIEVNLQTGYSENFKDLVPLQGELKDFNDSAGRDSLRESILSEGIIHPTFIWLDKDIKYIWDGHGRQKIYKELAKKGYEIPLLPVVYLLAKNKADAKIKLLKKEQDYGRRVTKEGLYDFIENESIGLESLEGLNFLDLGEIDTKMIDDMVIDLKKPKPKPKEKTNSDTPVGELPKQVTAKMGDIYELGNHRLMCGDSTKISDINKLMDGKKADMIHTDPPYNIGYEGGSKKRESIANDKLDDFNKFLEDIYKNYFLSTKPGAPIYVWHASTETHNFISEFIKAGFLFKSYIIWNKNNSTFGRSDYHWKHEPAIYGWHGEGTHKWCGDRKQTTVWDIDRPSRSDEHPTMKPIALCEKAIINSSIPGAIITDFFGGSGSTLIACENLKRFCYMMEFEPGYIDVIIDRWERHTGKKAVKIM